MGVGGRCNKTSAERVADRTHGSLALALALRLTLTLTLALALALALAHMRGSASPKGEARRERAGKAE